ncbi:MAG: hypothetical protein CVU56_27345, partial [Deltaproteobacteria bacterium HGW-Deltaproteobacteria-14]
MLGQAALPPEPAPPAGVVVGPGEADPDAMTVADLSLDDLREAASRSAATVALDPAPGAPEPGGFDAEARAAETLALDPRAADPAPTRAQPAAA